MGSLVSVQSHSGKNSKIVFLCICICYEIKSIFKIFFHLLCGPFEQLCLHLQQKNQKYVSSVSVLVHQNRTIAIASDFRVDGAKSPEILQKEGVLGTEIAARNRRWLAIFHRTLKSQCSIAFSCLGNRCDFWGPRWASQSQKSQKIATISVR